MSSEKNMHHTRKFRLHRLAQWCRYDDKETLAGVNEMTMDTDTEIKWLKTQLAAAQELNHLMRRCLNEAREWNWIDYKDEVDERGAEAVREELTYATKCSDNIDKALEAHKLAYGW